MTAYDADRGQIVLFGGCVGSYPCRDSTTWVSRDGSSWTQLHPTTSPTGRAESAMVWDPDIHKVVLFGGFVTDASGAGVVSNDTWTWDGANWAHVAQTGTQPAARADAAVAYDPQLHGVVVFAGAAGPAGTGSPIPLAPNDTWLFNGTSWIQLLPAGQSTAPTYRSGGSLSYSSVGEGQLVLFGGAACPTSTCSAGPVVQNDTWIFTSTGWVKQAPAQSPPARAYAVLLFDAELSAPVLFGGSGPGVYLNDTWAWTGSTWLSAAAGTAAPSTVIAPQAVAMPTGRILLFGGFDLSSGPAATLTASQWVYDAKAPVLGVSVSTPAGASAYYAGDVVTVTVTAQNTGLADLLSSDLTTLQATLVSAGQTGLSAVGTAVQWSANPNDPVAACRSLPAGSATTALLNGLIPTVDQAALVAGCSATATFLAVVVGSPSGCALFTIGADTVNMFGATANASTQVPICGNGLGSENWWSYDNTDLGGGASANVNVANGNLVVKQTDSTPILSHGDLGFTLGRAYNSQDRLSGSAAQGSVLGAGWQFDIGATGTAASGLSIGNLIVPTVNSLLQPLAVTYVDRDGTRFVFRPKTPTLDNVSGSLLSVTNLLSPTSLSNLVNLPGVTTLLGQDLNSIAQSLLGGPGSQPAVCIDTTFASPAGADMSLFRYLAVAGSPSGPGSCSSASSGGGVTIGYSLVRPDRLRYDFNLEGQLSDVVDGAGNTMNYTYDTLNRPSNIYSASCVPTGVSTTGNPPVSGAACPQYSFTYDQQQAGDKFSRFSVTDPAGRVTSYVVASADLASGTLAQLTQVWNPDNPYTAGGVPSVQYTYSNATTKCPGSAATSSTPGLLCSATDPRGSKTTFAYTAAPLGPDRVLSVTDRRANSSASDGGPSNGNEVVYSYHDAAAYTTADSATPAIVNTSGGPTGCSGNAACQRIRYTSIDTTGSVGEIDQGDASDAYLSQQAYFWDNNVDGGVQPCRQPDETVDNNLCETITRAKPSTAPLLIDHPGTATVNGVTVRDKATRYVYGDLGEVLSSDSIIDPSQAWTNANSAVTTHGAHTQLVEAGDKVRAFDDAPIGSGAVNSITAATGDYTSAVLADNPSVFYRLDELSGLTAADSSGNSRDAAYAANNVPLGVPGGVPGDTAAGDVGPAFIGSLASLPSFASGTGAGSGYTVEAWEKTSSADITYVACSPCGSGGMVLGRYNGLPWVWMSGGPNTLINVLATTSVADGKWHQVDYSYDGSGKASGVSIYIDGKASPTQTYNDTLGSTSFRTANTPMYFDFNATGTLGDDAAVGELSMYPAPISAARVAAHYATVRDLTRTDGATVYAVTDQSAQLTARGNAASAHSHWGDYLTTYVRDVPTLAQGTTTAAPTPGTPLSGTVCDTSAQSYAPTNTGLLCATVTPASAGVAAGDCPTRTVGANQTPPTSSDGRYTCTSSTYNTFGEMVSMRSANAHATGSTQHTTYTYYADTGTCTDPNSHANSGNCDLSGNVSAGGWLKAVTDVAGNSVLYAYDRAGGIARTWDRNATSGHSLSDDWTNASHPPSTQYAEADMASPITSASLSAGVADAEIVRATGTVWGSGGNSQNELGNGTAAGSGTSSTTPVPAAGLSGVVQIAQNASGGYYNTYLSAARTNTGAVYTWGNNQPVTRVAGLPSIISLAIGGAHYLALDNTGGLWAWGNNGYGQVGNGTTGGTVTTPVKVLTGVSAIAAGANASYAVKTDGSLWSWGDNLYGQLGTGDTTAHTSPARATGLSNVISVSAGLASAYAVETDGTAWSWGSNTTGALGTGASASTVTTPARITALAAGSVRQIVGSAFGAAALMTDGTVRAWGLNNVGQLGTATSNSGTPVTVPGVSGQVALAGGWATYVAADAGGALTIWGATNSGQIGDGTTPSSSAPTAMVAAQTISPYTSPWRYARGKRDPAGNLSTLVTDPIGDIVQSTPARGNAVLSSAYDTTISYNALGKPITSTTPLERDSRGSDGTLTGTPASSTISYDTFGNSAVSVDPRGYATVTTFDALNRPVQVQKTRGSTGDSTGSGCSGTASTANGFTSAQSGHVLCTVSTTYDGLGQKITVSDALAQTTSTTYDGLGRAIAITTPRNDGTYARLTSYTNYDVDGHALDTCPPRQTSAPTNATSSCTATGVYSTHTSYDTAGRVTTQTRYRVTGSGTTPLQASYSYDADGNQISATDPNGHTTTASYNLLDRKTAMTAPRRGPTQWRYDPAGNVTAVIAPGSAYLGSGVDGPLVVDGATNPRSNPFVVPDNAQYTNVTLTNGGWITGQSGTDTVFVASGTVTICGTCGIDEAGKGQPGGAASSQPATAGGNGQNVSIGVVTAGGGQGGQGSTIVGAGGGGGSHRTLGTSGAGTGGGTSGSGYGSATLDDIGTTYTRGTGAGGGAGGTATLATGAGNGGNGGGLIHITAATIIVNGTLDASGANGGASTSSAGGGGGGAGGSIWLTGASVTQASGATVSVAGGAGGSSTLGGAGGHGGSGNIRIDSDTATDTPSGATGERTSNITAYSYDADNRVVDTVAGAQTTDATDLGPVGTPDSDGLANTRSRTIYDADGHTIATLPPQAFGASPAPTQLTVNSDDAQRVDYDLDGHATASYDPRYSAGIPDTGTGNDGGTGINQQTTQCRTGTTPSYAPGLSSYSASVGVCVTREQFDANGNAVRMWLPTSNGADNRYLTRTYTDDNLVLTQTTPNPTGSGRVTSATYRYDGDGRAISTTDANGNTSTASYTADGLQAETDGQCYHLGTGSQTGPCTWSAGTTITHRTTSGYDADGNLITVTAPRAQNPTQSTSSGLNAADYTTTTTWTTDGLKAALQAPGLGHGDYDLTTYTYDKDGNPLTVTMPSANAATADADNPSRLSTTYSYTDDNLIASSATPVAAGSNRVTSYGYNLAGQKVTSTVCTTSSTTSCPTGTALDAAHGEGVTTYSYGPNGLNTTQIAKPGSSQPTTIRTSYDPAGRPIAVSDSTTSTIVTASYYLDGLTRSADDGTNTNTYAYDATGQLTSRTDHTATGGITDGATLTTSYSYNDAGLPRTWTSDVTTGATTTLNYDQAGRTTSVVDAGTGTGQTRTATYLPDNSLATLSTRVSGDNTDRLDYAYAYDNDGNITSQTTTGANTTDTYTNTYGYNPAGNLTTYAHAPTTGTATSTTYNWDHNANRTQATITGTTNETDTWTYRPDNSITSETTTIAGTAKPTQNYTYDKAGRLTTISYTPSGGTAVTCVANTYDGMDRIAEAVTTKDTTGCGNTTGSTVDYTYDGLDRQRSATVTADTTAAANGVTTSVYDGLSSSIVGQTGATTGNNSRPTTIYELTPGNGYHAVKQTRSGTGTSLLDDDGHTNITLLLGTGDGATGCSVAYDPFGNPAAPAASPGNGLCLADNATSSNTTGNALWYRASSRDGTTGNYQLGTRTYTPTNGTFTTPDSYRTSTPATDLSVGTDPLTANTYTYVNGNPLNFSDPNGHCPVDDNGRCDLATTRLHSAILTATADATAAAEKQSRALYSQFRSYLVRLIQEDYEGTHDSCSLTEICYFGTENECHFSPVLCAAKKTHNPTLIAIASALSAQDEASDPCYSLGCDLERVGKAAISKVKAILKDPGTWLGAAVFLGCSALGGAESGVGEVGCAAAAGAVGGVASAYAGGCRELKCTLKAALVGAAIGAATAGILRGAGKILRSSEGRTPSIGDEPSTPSTPKSEPSDSGSGTPKPTARFISGSDGTVTDSLGGNVPDAITLGRYPAYTDAASADGSRVFNVGEAWGEMAARDDRFGGQGPGSEIWIRNSRYLDRAIDRGSEVRLASDPFAPENAGSFFLREVDYLEGKGLHVEGDRMVR